MAFNSAQFLFVFFPVVLAVHFILGNRYRNLWLLAAGFLFFILGDPAYAWLLLFSAAINYGFGLRLDDMADSPGRDAVLGAAISLNLAVLVYFRYANFLIAEINRATALLAVPGIPSPFAGGSIHLPMGITFITFEAVSYLVDIYRKDAPALKDPIKTALFISMFPKIIAGPIEKYRSADGLAGDRVITAEKFFAGSSRFIVGFGKKILIADTLAVAADRIFALPAESLTTQLAWAGILCFSLQLYFDFSGYADMAIGLGRMFGFDFPENFRYPFAALSIREHWRRWCITFGDWMRDYLYLPLGGSRRSPVRTYVNLGIVFAAGGLLFGAGWNFMLWGLWNGLFAALERAGFMRTARIGVKPLRWLYTMLVMMSGYVLFRTQNPGDAGDYFLAMYGFASGGPENHIFYYVQTDTAIAFAFGLMGSFPLCPIIDAGITGFLEKNSALWRGFFLKLYRYVKVSLLAGLLGLSVIRMSAETPVPFWHVYFR